MTPMPFLASVLLSANLVFLTGCLPDGDQIPAAPEPVPESSTGTVTLAARAAPLAARRLSPEPGGQLRAEISHPLSRTSYKDSASWNGASGTSIRILNIPEGRGYQAVLVYRDPTGLATHADTLRDLEVHRATNTQASFELKALLGRIQLVVPSAPTTTDTLGLAWESDGKVLRSKAVRGPSGRTLLRLDSLTVGTKGYLRVRAWNAVGDTLFFADTLCTILSQSDQSISIKMSDARGQLGLSAQFLPGGETDAVASFPGDALPTGALAIQALSDSGTSDWMLLQNLSSESLAGPTRITRGTESFSVDLKLAPGARAVLTRATCDMVAASTHPLHGADGLVCGIGSVSVSWSNTGTLWEVRTPDGALADQFVVMDGKYGWSDLNSSSARTIRRKPGATALDASAGRSWCADDLDSPAATCI